MLVTGGSGFIGRAIVGRMLVDGIPVRAAVRREERIPEGVQAAAVVDLAADGDLSALLVGCSVVVHAAARAHVLTETAPDSLSLFRRINTDATIKLARQAAQCGVPRFVFLSSVGVNGNITSKPFTENDAPAPIGAYAISKYEAEMGLRAVEQATGLEVVIIRPPLVYGAGAPGNFLKLLRALDQGLPIPLGAIENQRSLVSLDNLVDLIISCTQHSDAAGETFLVSDGEDLSTPDLLRRTGLALGRPARLVPIPVKLLRALAMGMGKDDVVRRLVSSLQVDITKARTLLQWAPPISVDSGLHAVANWYLGRKAAVV